MACGSGVGPEFKNLERLAAARSGVTATSFGGSEPFGALIFLFQLAGQTCVPCQPVGGAPLRGGWAGFARPAYQSPLPGRGRGS